MDRFVDGFHAKEHHVAETHKKPYVDYLRQILQRFLQRSDGNDV
jgi:hypothetical protein